MTNTEIVFTTEYVESVNNSKFWIVKRYQADDKVVTRVVPVVNKYTSAEDLDNIGVGKIFKDVIADKMSTFPTGNIQISMVEFRLIYNSGFETSIMNINNMIFDFGSMMSPLVPGKETYIATDANGVSETVLKSTITVPNVNTFCLNKRTFVAIDAKIIRHMMAVVSRSLDPSDNEVEVPKTTKAVDSNDKMTEYMWVPYTIAGSLAGIESFMMQIPSVKDGKVELQEMSIVGASSAYYNQIATAYPSNPFVAGNIKLKLKKSAYPGGKPAAARALSNKWTVGIEIISPQIIGESFSTGPLTAADNKITAASKHMISNKMTARLLAVAGKGAQ